MKKELVLDTEKIHDLRYHVVYKTKNGRPLFSDDKLRQALEEFFNDKECNMITEYRFLPHAIDMVIKNDPELPIHESTLIIKELINALVRDESEGLLKKTYGNVRTMWSPGYYIAALGVEESERIKKMNELWLKEPKKPRITLDEFFADIRRNN